MALQRDVLTPTNFAGLRVTRPNKDQVSKINALIYGEAGVGKTWLAGSAAEVPSMRNVLYLDAEAGQATLREHPDVEVLTTSRWQQYIDIYNALKAGGHSYKTVVLDSLSEIAEQCKDQVMVEMKLDPENEKRDEDVPSIREWGKLQVRLLRLIRLYRDLDMNVIFVAHAERVQLKTGRYKWMPMLNGKMQMKVPQIPDIVLFMYNQEVDGEQRRLMLTRQTDTAVAKVRGADMPQIIGAEETVTMKTIMDYYNATREK
jgi:phage nucleotide-binding protein